ncbi:hypothetical protein FQK07_12045 [Synechococcus sp. BSF8S]|uniref:hypothetical protein n=1 Tax=Synechococcales TaxID=1890424 RepID=UPI0016294626|nr:MULTISPECIES: hypothetical protein [unclassified Synechococcus]MBC1261981.1 hypothetical protein [Synechococcus sp. BSF8S]MBC1264908.1 hypothetical protein [Synechococcus sp. BSA11S]
MGERLQHAAYSLDIQSGDATVFHSTDAINLAKSEKQERWTLSGQGDAVRMLNCDDCGDDVGAELACQGSGQPALLSLFWAAVIRDDPMRSSLVISVADQSFERKAETIFFGMLGHVPKVEVYADDPLFEALSHGSQMEVRFSGVETTISLEGFSTALKQFALACPWRPGLAPMDNDGHSNLPQTDKMSDLISIQEGWMLSEANDPDTGDNISTLSFGIAQTDAIAFQATCSGGEPNSLIKIIALVGIDEAPEGEITELVVVQNDSELRLPGKISTGHSTYPGILATVDHRHALWSLMQSQESVRFSRAGGQSTILPASETSYLIARFLRTCLSQEV